MNFGALVCPDMFLVGGWVLPELQQICGVQFGSGANPGGHVIVSFGATVIYFFFFFYFFCGWPLGVFPHPPLTFQVVCE